jgi:hypothetical protein
MATLNAEVVTPPVLTEATVVAKPAEATNQPQATSVPQVIPPGTRIIRK